MASPATASAGVPPPPTGHPQHPTASHGAPSPPSYGTHGGMNHFAPGPPPPTHKKCGGLSPCCIVSIVLGCLFVVGLIVVLFVVALAAGREDRTPIGQLQKVVDDHMPVPQCPALDSWPVVSSGTSGTYLHPVYDKFANNLDAVFAVNTAVDTKITVQTGLAIAPRSPAYVLSDELVQPTNYIKTTAKKFPSDKRLAFAGLHAWATTAAGYQKAADALQDNVEALQKTLSGGPVMGEAEKALALELNTPEMGGMVVPAGERWVPVVWDAELRNSNFKATGATDKVLKVPFGVLHGDSTNRPGTLPLPGGDGFYPSHCTRVPVPMDCRKSPLVLRRLLVDAAAKKGVDMDMDGSGGIFPVGFNLWTLIEDKGNNFPLVFPDLPGKVYRARAELENLRNAPKKFSLMHVLQWKKALALRLDVANLRQAGIPANRMDEFLDILLSLGSAAALQKWVDSNNNEEPYQLFGDVDSIQPGGSYVFKNFDLRPGGFPTFHGAATRVGASPGFMAGVVPPGALRRSTESRLALIRESVLKDIMAEKQLSSSDLEAMGFKQEVVMR